MSDQENRPASIPNRKLEGNIHSDPNYNSVLPTADRKKELNDRARRIIREGFYKMVENLLDENIDEEYTSPTFIQDCLTELVKNYRFTLGLKLDQKVTRPG